MKTKIFTYLILLPLLLGLSSYVDAQITTKIFGVGPNTEPIIADDIVLIPPTPGGSIISAGINIPVEVSGLPILSEDFNLELINFIGSLPQGWTTVSIISPSGTKHILADKSAGSWTDFVYGQGNKPNHKQINPDCSDAPSHSTSVTGIKSFQLTNSFKGEDPNGTWKLEFGEMNFLAPEGLYYDRFSLVFRAGYPFLATSTVTKPSTCTAADGNVKFKLYVGGCNTKGGFYKFNGGTPIFVPYDRSALSAEITVGSLKAGIYGLKVYPAINSTTPDLTKEHLTVIDIVDDTPPVISCPPAQTVTLDETGKKIFNITHPTATDNCGTPTTILNVKYIDGASDAIGGLSYNNLKVSPGASKAYNIKGVGKAIFEFVTKDASGLTTKCSTTVTSLANTNYCANDTEAPYFPFGECRDYFIVYDANSQASFNFRAPYYFDNCEVASRKVFGTYSGGALPVSGPTIFSADFVSGISSPYTIKGAGSLELKFEVTDKKGNKGTCTSIIRTKIRTGPCLNDLTKPVLTNCHANANINLNNTTNQAAFKYTTPLLSDNCGVDSTRITMTYLDGATGILGETSREWFNVRGGVTSNDFYVEGTGRVEFNFYVYDQSKNESKCTTTFTVVAGSDPCDNDTEKPMLINCQADQIIALNAALLAPISYTVPSFTDNCEVPLTTVKTTYTFLNGATNSDGSLGWNSELDPTSTFELTIKGVGNLEIKYEVTDKKGNVGSCTTVYTTKIQNNDPCVNDTEKPKLTNCPSNQMVMLDANGQIKLSITQPTYSDNCAVDMTSFTVMFLNGVTNSNGTTTPVMTTFTSGAVISPTFIGTGSVVLNYEVNDKAGNSATCSATITTNGSTDPCSGLNPVLSIAGTPCVNNEMSIAGATGASYIEWKNDNQVVSTTAATSTKAANGTTIAGNSNGTAGNGLSQLNNPTSVFVDKQGNTYVVDINNERVLKFASGSTTGTIVAGGNGAGPDPNQVNGPHNIFVDDSGNVYVSEFWNHRVTKWAPGAGTGTVVAGGNGGGVNANQLQTPQGLYVDGSGTIYIADSGNHRILKWASGATSGTVIGKDVDGPTEVSLDGSGNIYVSEVGWFRIKKFPSNATNTTNGVVVVQDASGSANGLHIDGAGFIYLCNGGDNRIMKYPPNSTSSTVGTVIAGGNGAGAGANQLKSPASVFVDHMGVIYVADRENNRIQKWTQTTSIVPIFTPTVAGTYTADVATIEGCKKTTSSIVITTCNPCDNDNTPPTLKNCPSNQAVVLNPSGSQVFELLDPKVIDNCPIALTELKMTFNGGTTDANGMKTYSTIQFQPTPVLYTVKGVGTIDIVYTAIDVAGNISKCASVMTVVGAGGACMNDIAPPTTNNCPPNQVINLVDGKAVLEVTTPTFMDNCVVESIKLVTTYSGGVTNSAGEVERTFNNIFSGQKGTFIFVGAGKSTFDFIAFDPNGNEGKCRVTYTTVFPGTNPLFNIASACAVAGQNISLPVTVTRFKEFGSFNFDLHVPAGSGLSFVGLEKENIANVSFNVLPNKDLRVTWIEPSGNNLTLEDNFRVFNVVLAANASFNQPSTVTGLELAILSDVNDNGSISIGNICVGSSVTPLGKIYNPLGKPHADVSVNLVVKGETVNTTATNGQGGYTFDFTNNNYRLKPSKNDEVRKGVDMVDVAKIKKHSLHKELFDNNYKYVAADVNKDGRINSIDEQLTNRVFLRKRNDFPNNTSWRYLPKALDISSNPLDLDYPEQINLLSPNLDFSNLDFYSIKTGDVDFSSLANFKGGNNNFNRSAVTISIPDTTLAPSNEIRIPVYVTGNDKISVLSMVMKYDTSIVKFKKIESNMMEKFVDGNYNDLGGEVILGWYHPDFEDFVANGVLMTLVFEGLSDIGNSAITLEDVKFYDTEFKEFNSNVEDGSITFMTSSVHNSDYSHKITASPNPFLNSVSLNVETNTPQPLSITFTDVSGKVLKQMDIQNKSSNHQITVNDIEAKGVIIVLVKGDDFSETLRLIKL